MPYKDREAKNRQAREYWARRGSIVHKKRYAATKDDWYWKSIMRRFGLTKERYEAMFALGCWLCGEPFPESEDRYQVHVDHCHETNEVRGLAHGSCNSLIGHAKENFGLLRRIANALEARCTKTAITK